MRLVRYNTANPVFTNSMAHLFGNAAQCGHHGHKKTSVPVDIHETESSIVIQADMPGVDKKDVSIDLKEGVLTISADRMETEEVKKESYFKRERATGKIKRFFTLTDRVNQEDIKASMANGVLTVEIPKAEEVKPRQISID
jgi:HSP20 family protein